MATPTPSTNTPQKHLAAFSSPAPRSVPAMMNYDSPAVLNMLSEGGVGMGISMSGMGMSQLGLSASAMGRADEDERRRRLENIIATLKEKPGRVGEEGIVALCKKEGMEIDRDSPEPGVQVLVLAIGAEAMCEVTLRNGEVESVNLQLASDSEEDNMFAETGSKILLKNLKPLPGQSKINLTLERFSQNLDSLLRMDKLSAENGGVKCYKAIFRVYASLRKLFEHEKKLALDILGANTPYSGQKAERKVLCEKSGRPRINAGSCLGLSLEYWMDRRHLITRKSQDPSSSKGKEKMDIDSGAVEDDPEGADHNTNKIYSLVIECESSPSSMYTPIRIPDSWISENIEKAPDAQDVNIDNILLNTSQIDWLDPKPTYLEASAPEGDHDAMNLDAGPGRLPNIRFVAKFNPPLVVPLSVWINLHQSVGLNITPQDVRATTFVGLAIRPSEPDPGMNVTGAESTPEVRSKKTVLVKSAEGKEEERQHTCSLLTPKTEYSRTLESLPFHHPRQLVEILPTLRQYAFTTSLLKHTFHSPNQTPLSPSQKTPTSPLSPPMTPSPNPSLPIHLDLSLTYSPPAPRLTLHLPHPASTPASAESPSPTDLLAALLASPSSPTVIKPPLKVSLEVLSNAELMVSDQNVLSVPPIQQNKDEDVDMERAHAVTEKQKRVARALEVCGDLGIWGEWLRKEASKV
ncbi:hypothetical protein BS50DRAFT_186787 [Corynespora cassiicola Philippines]|uniref:Mediator of RNA polymerase II transcription subunit 1 n=1 Tax=Corynespora cassiicola Philippines TaxID=1448308 RepID=A0A2T2P7C0_CORCC|nr:hypothetical protein BS50DRAFT_186787 [Corynespora cassiicola Philippines]